jgi:general secretion pathway protein D
VANEEYFKVTATGVVTNIDLQKIETGTVLSILPRIGENGDITLEIASEVSNVTARASDDLPFITRRTAKSTIRVKDGGTAAIAGLMDARDERVDQKVPGASNVPLFGELFKNRAGNKQSKQVAIFITARLVPERGPDMQQAHTRPVAIPPVNKIAFQAELREALKRCPM